MAEQHATHNARKRGLTAIDLFSGCGGLSEGLRQADFDVIGAIEIDKLAASTYQLNHPHVRLWAEDIRKVTISEVRKVLSLRPGELDLLAGCPPCQGFSSIRTLNGSADVRDRRNALTDEFLRFVKGLRPKVIMLENVPGLATKHRFREFEKALRKLDYEVESKILDAADFGVPQRRRRLILLAAYRQKISSARESPRRRTVRGALKHLPHPTRSRDPLHAPSAPRSERVKKLIRLIPKDGGSRASLPKSKWLGCHKRCAGFRDVYGRMKWDDVAPTITGGCLNPSKGRFLHPSQNRAITPREAALLQTFPRSYQFTLEKGVYAVAEMIGNALPPEFIRRQALIIKQHLQRSGWH